MCWFVVIIFFPSPIASIVRIVRPVWFGAGMSTTASLAASRFRYSLYGTGVILIRKDAVVRLVRM